MTQLSNAPGVYCDVQQELDDSVPTIVFYLDLQHTVGLSSSGKTNLILSLNTSLGSSNISLSVVSFVPVGIERNFRDALLDLKDTRELGSFARYSLVESLPGSPVSPDGCFLRLEVDFGKVSRNFESVPLSSSGKSKLIVSTKGPLKIGNTTTQLNMFICEKRRMFVAGLYELAQNPIIKVHDSDVKNVVISVNCASLPKKEKNQTNPKLRCASMFQRLMELVHSSFRRFLPWSLPTQSFKCLVGALLKTFWYDGRHWRSYSCKWTATNRFFAPLRVNPRRLRLQ